MKTFELFTDGGARGNPGPAGIGMVLKTPAGEIVASHGQYIGETTNNVAEYTALLEGLKLAKTNGAEELFIFLDSELVVRQLNREYKVKEPHLARLFVQVWNVLQTFKKTHIDHIPRARNHEADALVNQALDQEMGLNRK